MDALLLIVRCLLAVIFLVAGFGKLLDLAGSRRALEEFGVPARLARVGGLALPIAELGTAVALLIRPSARAGAGVALALLAIFIAGVARALSEGRAPDCHCFGQIHSEPAGRSTLARNAVFAAGAAFVLARGSGPSVTGGLESLDAVQLALVATSTLAAALAVAVAQLVVTHRRLRRDLANLTGMLSVPGLPRGAAAPEFELEPVRGQARSLADLMTPARPAMLVFLTTNCGPCLQMLPALAQWQETLSESLSLLAIFSGERSEVERLCAQHDVSAAIAQQDNETFTLYALRATPSAVLIDANGVIAAAPAEGVPAIEALIRTRLAPSGPVELAVNQG
jgi:uncharacterized membrane protein YphA (DoxX/SURF4 family)/thiol-disulfide isomerase/thioredoxin